MTDTAAAPRSGVFTTAFAAIVATSFCFILRNMVVSEWGTEFNLSETQKGELLGVGLWPFSITIVLLSLLIDRIGFRTTFWFAAICHVAGLAVLLTANGYWALYIGTFIMALGNGAVEAAANPLIATIFSADKPKWLNRLHAAWPLGLILGGVLAIGLSSGNLLAAMFGNDVDWRAKVALMAIPVAVYAFLLLGRRFPQSERMAAGVPYKAMLAEAGFISAFIIIGLMMMEIGRVFVIPNQVTLGVIAALTAVYAWFSRSPGRPLYIVFVLLMIPLAITELSTDSWITDLMTPEMTKIGIDAGWVLVYTSAVMFVIRIFAGSLIHQFKPLGVLAAASLMAAAGLFWMAGATGLTILAAATLYGIGKSFFWGTNLGVVSEQFPRGGAVTINVMAGAGMLAAGIIGTMLLGSFQDRAIARGLEAHDAANSTQLAQTYLGDRTGLLGPYKAVDNEKLTMASEADKGVIAGITSGSKKEALTEVALVPLFVLFVYLGLIVFFRLRGGYRPVPINEPAAPLQ